MDKFTLFDGSKHGDIFSFIHNRNYIAGFGCAVELIENYDKEVVIKSALLPIRNDFDRGFVDGILEAIGN